MPTWLSTVIGLGSALTALVATSPAVATMATHTRLRRRVRRCADDVDRFSAGGDPTAVDYRTLLHEAQLEQIAFAKCKISSDRLIAMICGGAFGLLSAAWLLASSPSGPAAVLALAYSPIAWWLLWSSALMTAWRMRDRRNEAVAFLRRHTAREARDVAARLDKCTAPLYGPVCLGAHLVFLAGACAFASVAFADGRPVVVGALLPTTLIALAVYGIFLALRSREAKTIA